MALTSMPENHFSIVNVGGVSRSGTTMLHLMLGNASDAFACGEVSSWFRPHYEHHQRIACPCGEVPCPVWQNLMGASECQFHAEACRKLNVRFIVDSSKSLSWLLDVRRWHGRQAVNVFNVFIWKDPVDLAYSFWKRGYHPMRWRNDFVQYYGRLSRSGIPFFAVNYNELVSQPRSKLADVCRAIGMDYFDGKEQFWKKVNHHLFGSPSVRHQAESRESTIPARAQRDPGFVDQEAFVKDYLDADTKTQQLIKLLREHDVSALPEGSETVPFVPRPPYPAWYYWQRSKFWYRRHHPRPHPGNRLNEKVI